MEERVAPRYDDIKLAGILDLPRREADRLPAFMVLHGLGAHKYGASTRSGARMLNELGYATLRIDMVGGGTPKGREAESSVSNRWIASDSRWTIYKSALRSTVVALRSWAPASGVRCPSMLPEWTNESPP
jgi:cephalosporin-C deacetylase-like acetyl esterase